MGVCVGHFSAGLSSEDFIPQDFIFSILLYDTQSWRTLIQFELNFEECQIRKISQSIPEVEKSSILNISALSKHKITENKKYQWYMYFMTAQRVPTTGLLIRSRVKIISKNEIDFF